MKNTITCGEKQTSQKNALVNSCSIDESSIGAFALKVGELGSNLAQQGSIHGNPASGNYQAPWGCPEACDREAASIALSLTLRP